MVASPRKTAYSLGATKDIEDDNMFGGEAQTVMTRRSIVASMGAAAALTFGMSTPVAFADEYGRETEAAFLSTGETVMICTKRGPLGKCEKTELRTLDNDNDKSEKYFRQPTEVVKRKDNEARMAESTEGNALIERLKKQSEENSEKNELLVYQRTLMNDSVRQNCCKTFFAFVLPVFFFQILLNFDVLHSFFIVLHVFFVGVIIHGVVSRRALVLLMARCSFSTRMVKALHFLPTPKPCD